ncbi:unnamed protein product [Vitrella brassicaformis CCMP3155]|uniref:Uncharacterized protein n=1 Tax=Vitrella brassicaformis (strain CCMP3155) TaxID=1169540 RepID=A0A0G4H304_VITBC|nr:unnamed protein product [Vitrella brassicaformis CCMP3155]|eukprot:CEM38066.1 unnamed protein product [Vitrella brassicaformis CCMP3155]
MGSNEALKTAKSVDSTMPMTSVEDIFEKYIPDKEREVEELADANNFEVKLASIVNLTVQEELRAPHIVRIASLMVSENPNRRQQKADQSLLEDRKNHQEAIAQMSEPLRWSLSCLCYNRSGRSG